MSGGKTEMPDNATEETAGKGGSKKLLIIGLVAGLLFGGGVAAAYFLFLAPKPEAVPVAEETPKEDPKLSSGIFVKLERLSAPLVVNDQVSGYVLLDLSLELVEAGDEAMVTQRLPILKDAFLREVTRAPIGKTDQPMVIDYENLVERLKTVANQELKRAVIDRVLISQTTRI